MNIRELFQKFHQTVANALTFARIFRALAVGMSTWILHRLLFWRSQEVSKFINYCNEVKAATVACKEGGQLSIVKPPQEPSSGGKK